MNATQIINSRFKSKNIITPNVLKCGFTNKNNYVYELSQGIGIDSQYIYGVTLVDKNTLKHLCELCKMFDSKDDAINYIDSL